MDGSSKRCVGTDILNIAGNFGHRHTSKEKQEENVTPARSHWGNGEPGRRLAEIIYTIAQNPSTKSERVEIDLQQREEAGNAPDGWPARCRRSIYIKIPRGMQPGQEGGAGVLCRMERPANGSQSAVIFGLAGGSGCRTESSEKIF